MRRPPAKLTSTIENAESLSPVDLFNSYAKSIQLTGDFKAFCEEIITEDVVEENEEGKLDTGDESNKFSTSTHLRKSNSMKLKSPDLVRSKMKSSTPSPTEAWCALSAITETTPDLQILTAQERRH